MSRVYDLPTAERMAKIARRAGWLENGALFSLRYPDKMVLSP